MSLESAPERVFAVLGLRFSVEELEAREDFRSAVDGFYAGRDRTLPPQYTPDGVAVIPNEPAWQALAEALGRKPLALVWTTASGVKYTEKFVFQSISDIQEKEVDSIWPTPLSSDFAILPPACASDKPFFDKNLFWSMSIYWKALSTTGYKPWDSQLLAAEAPAANHDLAIRSNRACATCKAEVAKFRCKACKVTRYCSVECQSKNWAMHRELCSPTDLDAIVNFSETAVITRVPEPKPLTPEEQAIIENKDGRYYWGVDTTLPMFCSACQTSKAFMEFSKSQARKEDHERKCKACVESKLEEVKVVMMKCTACGEEMPSDCFSTSQRKGPATKRKCMACVDSMPKPMKTKIPWGIFENRSTTLEEMEKAIADGKEVKLEEADKELLQYLGRIPKDGSVTVSKEVEDLKTLEATVADDLKQN